jgi:hypothetical protein
MWKDARLISSPNYKSSKWILALGAFGVLLNLATPPARADIILNQAAQYGILFEGGGGNTLQITNVTVNGNVGVGNTGKATDSGPSTINGGLFFSAANTGQFSNNNASNVITGGVHYSVSNVASALNWVNGLNTTLGGELGTSVNINHSTTINASAGVLDANGNRVFTVTGFNTTNSDVLTIVGDAAHDNVVLNFTSSANFNNQVVLKGINSDSVLYNFVGGSNLTGGPTLQINNNASSNPGSVQGIFLDPNGAISVTNARVLGRVFGGDSHDYQYVSGSTLSQPLVVPEPSSLALTLSALSLGSFGWLRRARRSLE